MGSLRRRLEALERRGHSSGTYRTPEREAERERRFDDLWKKLYEEYGISRGEPIKSRKDAVGDLCALVEEHRGGPG